MELKKDQVQIFREGIEKIGKHPCAICSAKAGAAAGFIPDDLKAFDMEEGSAIYFPICLECVTRGFDPEFLEAVFLHAGVKLTLD